MFVKIMAMMQASTKDIMEMMQAQKEDSMKCCKSVRMRPKRQKALGRYSQKLKIDSWLSGAKVDRQNAGLR